MSGLWFDVGRNVRRIDDGRACTIIDTWKESERWAGRHLIRGKWWAKVVYDDDHEEGFILLSKLAPPEVQT